jgi:sugar phosphate isomerase/epimerase
MDWGIPTMIGLDSLEEHVDLCREIGLSFIELNMNDPRFVPERVGSSELRKITRKTGIFFTVHLPEELDLASFQPPLRRAAVERCGEAIQWAAEAGIRLLNLHIHKRIYFTLPDQKVWVYERTTDEFAGRLHESMEEIWKMAA